MKTLYCAECRAKVATVEKGSFLKKGMVALCSGCEKTRITAKNYLRNIGKDQNKNSSLFDMFPWLKN